MKLITVDFETYYDRDYSLSKMQTDAYILDGRFEIIGVSVKIDNGKTQWFEWDEAFEQKFKALPWEESAVICHNAQFDGFIMSQVLEIFPKLWMCTLSMGRAMYPWLRYHSLAKMAEHLGKGKKGTEVIRAIGKRKADFSQNDLDAYGKYCINDVNLTRDIYDEMSKFFPAIEYQLVDITVRMFTEPLLQLDEQKLVVYRDQVVSDKEELLSSSNLSREEIMSNPKFAGVLIALGVTPPTKISIRTGKESFAFAKTDKAFKELLEHEDVRVQAAVAARLGVKTTIAETRAAKFIETARRGIGFPVFLHYWGAKITGRYSGGNKINAQNLPNRGRDRVIREAIIAPEGYKIVVGDSSNIELRVNLVAAGEDALVEKIKEYDALGIKATSDLYCDFASSIYDRPVVKKDGKPVDKQAEEDRFMGKTSELGLGYGCGWMKFKEMVRQLSGGLVTLADMQSESIVTFYRTTHKEVVKLWNRCNKVILTDIHNGTLFKPVDVNGWARTNNEGFFVPGNIGVVYKDLHKNQEGDWIYTTSKGPAKIYGGKMVENLAQHLARHIVMWQLAKVNRKYRVVLTVHDEIVCCVPEEQAEECRDYVLKCLREAPKWCKGLIPLDGEVGIGDSYGEAK